MEPLSGTLVAWLMLICKILEFPSGNAFACF